jgi:hypothetical protein
MVFELLAASIERKKLAAKMIICICIYIYIVCNKLGKPMIIVLNKSDLVPKKCVKEWIEFLEKRTPGTHVMDFKSPQSSFRVRRRRRRREK